MKKMVTKEFTSNGSFTVPAGVTGLIIYGLGGGAGGYGGGAGSTTIGGNSGPGGISCAWLVNYVTVVPNTTYTITIGAGGTGATGSSSGTGAVNPISGDGGDTSFGSLAIFKGAKGYNTGGEFATTIGVSDRYVTSPLVVWGTGGDVPNQCFYGWYGLPFSTTTDVYHGWYFETGTTNAATGNTDDGGPGIAGNSSRFGKGGNGGISGIYGGTATGGNGGNAAANSGAGGGSGGGSAKSPGANLKGGDGGNGGSGRLLIMWFE